MVVGPPRTPKLVRPWDVIVTMGPTTPMLLAMMQAPPVPLNRIHSPRPSIHSPSVSAERQGGLRVRPK
jgi:hypothetical protein